MNFDAFQQLSFVNLDCEVFYWYKKGTANDCIIFLHGAGCDHFMFEKQLDMLGDAYNIIAWDARGHGLSKINNGRKFDFKDMYSDCLKLIAINKIEKAVLIGQSMGGNLAQEIAYYSPHMVSKCILINCTRNTQKLTAIEKMTLKISRPIFNLYPWKMLVKQSADACGKTEYTKTYVNRCFEKIGKESFIDIMMSLLNCLHEDKEFKFRHPVLLVYGKDDKTGNIGKAMKRWPKEDGNCKLCIIENAGHNSNQDNPNAVNENIKVFLELE